LPELDELTLPPLLLLLFALDVDAPVDRLLPPLFEVEAPVLLLLFDRLPVAEPPAPPCELLFAELLEVFAPFDIVFCGLLPFVFVKLFPFELAELPN